MASFDSVFDGVSLTLAGCVTLLFLVLLVICHRFYKKAEQMDAPMGAALSTCFWFRSLAGACLPFGVSIGLKGGGSCAGIDVFSKVLFISYVSWSVFALQIMLRVVKNPFLALGGMQKMHLVFCVSWIALGLLDDLVAMNDTDDVTGESLHHHQYSCAIVAAVIAALLFLACTMIPVCRLITPCAAI